jgi:Fic family protein
LPKRVRRPPPGTYVEIATAGETSRAFIPAPLPPNPAIVWSSALRRRFDDALVALGRLDALATHLPNAALLLYSFVRKEAVLSSQIEGTQSSLADLLLYEIDEQPGVPLDDAREVSHCVAAQEYGLSKLRGGLPLSMRMLNGMHKVLLSHPEGRGKAPGQVRRSQVWIGGTRPGNAVFVPPPANALADCLSSFERFLNDDPEPTPPLLKAALAHAQFETIHPFLDGNGRIGRLLIVLQLVADAVLREPLLYPSVFFKTHRALYYELLNETRLHGDWERWLDFFAEAIQASATQAASTARRLLGLIDMDRDRIAQLGRAAGSALRVHQALQRQPIVTSRALIKISGLSAATVNKSLAHLESLGVVREITNQKRGRVFSYRAFVDELGADPAQTP